MLMPSALTLERHLNGNSKRSRVYVAIHSADCLACFNANDGTGMCYMVSGSGKDQHLGYWSPNERITPGEGLNTWQDRYYCFNMDLSLIHI